jgi:hypothetical protein
MVAFAAVFTGDTVLAMESASPARRAMLTVAIGELGVRELANPAFDPTKPAWRRGNDPTMNDDTEGRIRMYLNGVGISATAGHHNAACCAAFASFAMRNASLTSINGTGGCGAMRNRFERAGRFVAVPQDAPYRPQPGQYRPQPGDIVFFGRDPAAPEHVGIVVGVDDDGTLHTLEGNTWRGQHNNDASRSTLQSGVMERRYPPTVAHGQSRGERQAIIGFGRVE